jgi:transcription-repair coupling factor (superfamily II helicase)
MANTASARITTVIAVTTDVVQAFRIRFDTQAKVAGHQRNEHAKRDAFQNTDHVVRQRHGIGQFLHEITGRQAQFDLGRDHAANECHRIGPDYQ